MKKILVTGSHGFIGRSLVKELERRGHKVYPIDHVIGIEATSSSPLYLYSHIKFDFIYHLAAPVGVDRVSDMNPYAMVLDLVEPLRGVIQRASRDGAKIIFTSTSEVHGMSDPRHPYRGMDEAVFDTVNQRWVYGMGKLLGEWMLKGTDLEYAITRYYNVYGANASHGVVNYLTNALLSGEEIRVNENAERSFLYIDDAVNLTIAAGEKPCGNHVFELGTRQSYSIIELLSVIVKLLKLDQRQVIKRLTYFSDPIGLTNRSPDLEKISMAHHLLKYNPKHSLMRGLEKMYEEKGLIK